MQLKTLFSAILAFVFVGLLPGAISAQEYGRATWYNQYGVAGSCGEYHSDSDYVAAVGPAWGHNALCGRYATVNWNGASVTVRIVDTCNGCRQNDIDLSVGAFQGLNGNLGLGNVQVEWNLD